MSTHRFAGRAIALGVMIASASFAAEEPVGVPLRIWGSAHAVSLHYEDPATMIFGGTFLETSPGAGNGTYFSGGFYFTPGAGTFQVPQKTVRAEPGKRYVIDVIGDWVDSFKLNASAPPGYEVELEGVVRKTFEATGIGPAYTGTVILRVVERREPFAGRAGVASQIDENKPHWSVALGSLKNGSPAGAISIIDAGTASSWSSLFTPAGLQYDSTSSEIQVYRVSGAIRQILANQAAVDVVTINSTTYELRFYNPGQVVGSTFPRTFTGEPYVVYEVTQGSTSTTLKVTSKTRNLSSLTSTGNAIVRTAVTTLARTGSWPTFDWTRNDWNTSGQTQVVEQYSDGSGTASARVENLEIRPPGGAAAVKVQRNYSLYGWGEQLEKEKLGTTNYVETTRDYYTTSSEPGRYGFLKSVTETGGNWTAYDYWDSGTAGAKTGQIKYKFRPWLGSPATVSFTTTTGEVTYYEYVADPFGANTRPSLVETKVNSVLTAKSTTSYSDVGTANGMTLVQAVRNDYSNSTTYLTTTTRFYKENTSDAFWRSQVHSVVQPGSLKTSFLRQRGSWSGTAFTKSGTAGTGAGTASKIATISGTTATGTLRSTEDGYDIDDLYLVTGQSTMEVTIRDASALVVRTESHVWTGSAWALIGWNNNTYTYAGMLTQTTASNGAIRDWSWNGEQLASQTDEAGVVVNYAAYYHSGLVKEVTKVGGPTTEFTYNAAGRVTQEKLKHPNTGETIITARAFDDAGRQTSETPPGLSATTFGYNPSSRTQTTTNPDSGTRTETYLLDGRLQKTTGTAIVEQFYSYAIESDGRRRTQVNTGTVSSTRWAKTWTDWLGRTIQEDVPTWGGGTGTRAHSYDSAGRLWKTTQPGLAATLRTYDSMGNLAAEGLDIDASNTLAGTSNDRVRLYSTTIYDSGSSTWWLKQTQSTYPIAVNATIKELGRTETKLTNLVTGRLSHVESFDIHGNKIVSYTEVDRTNKTMYAYVDVPDSTTDARQKSVNGLLTESKDTAGITTTFTYDTLGRPCTSTNPRTSGVTTTAYVTGTARVLSVTDPASVVQATYDYDSVGRAKSSATPNPNYSPGVDNRTSLFAYTSYTAKGQVWRQWGETTDPVEHTYDSYGQQTAMTTYATSTATFTGTTWPSSPNNPQTTTWTFHEPTGLLEKKTDAASKSVDYTYTTAGQVYERKWARILSGSTRVTTTYSYSATTGELTFVDYNDSTADITYTYNRLGSIATVYDNSGSRSFNYNLSGTLELQREDLPPLSASRRLTYEYDTATGFKGRPTAFKLGTSANPALDQHVSYTYQADGRLNGVNPNLGNGTFDYTYQGNSHLINKTENTTLGYKDQRTYDGSHDWLDARETTWGSGTPVTKAKFAYTQDNLGRVTDVAKTGTMFDRYATGSAGIKAYYGYNDRSELTSEVTKIGTGSTVLTGRDNPIYAYDKLGNRTSVKHNAETATYAAVNNLNRYSQRTVPGYFDVAGAAGSGATVTVNGSGSGVSRHHEYFFKKHPLANTSNPVYTTLTISDGTTFSYLLAFLQKTPEAFTYDDDGNLKTDGRWEYGYDAENRPNWIRAAPAAVTAGHPDIAWLLQYDYLGRRNYKQPLVYNGSAYEVSTPEERFVYNGWNLVAEFLWNASTSTYDLKRSYTWGMDIAGAGQRAGGIGGLLLIKDGSNKYVPAYDAMGNLHALMTTASVTLGGTNYAAGDIVASYEYDAFGQTIRESGPYAATNPFRYSTKYTDNETGLVYFGLRYYSPSLGRFIHRDPISESGGLNLYGYVANNSVNRWDYLGMWFTVGGRRILSIPESRPKKRDAGRSLGIDLRGEDIESPFTQQGIMDSLQAEIEQQHLEGVEVIAITRSAFMERSAERRAATNKPSVTYGPLMIVLPDDSTVPATDANMSQIDDAGSGAPNSAPASSNSGVVMPDGTVLKNWGEAQAWGNANARKVFEELSVRPSQQEYREKAAFYYELGDDYRSQMWRGLFGMTTFTIGPAPSPWGFLFASGATAGSAMGSVGSDALGLYYESKANESYP